MAVKVDGGHEPVVGGEHGIEGRWRRVLPNVVLREGDGRRRESSGDASEERRESSAILVVKEDHHILWVW